VRFVIAFTALLVVACGRPADRLADPRRAATQPPGPAKSVGAAPTAASASAPAAAVVLPSVGCPTPTCAFHAGAGGYFTCLAGGAGACFHFGAPCAPPDGCMFDPGDRTYKQCARVSEGTCQQWASACAPATRCMFDVADGLHHTCDDVSGGTCKRFGAPCAP
jgi:hypothetical protein